MSDKRKRDGRSPKLHMIDGQLMTASEIANMLGMTKTAIVQKRSNMGGCSYQMLVNMYRNGEMMSKHDRWPRHRVHGRWMTSKQVAEELGCKTHSIDNWRRNNRDKNGIKPTMEEAYDHFKGAPKRGNGGQPKVHWVNGKRMTVRQAAKKYDTTASALWQMMFRHHCSLETAVKRVVDWKTRKAQREIMKILNGNGEN